MKKDINETERKKIISQEMSRRNKLRKHPSGGFYDKQKAREAGLKGLKKRWGYDEENATQKEKQEPNPSA